MSRGFNQMENVLEAETGHLRITIVHESVALTGRSFCIRKSLPRVRFTPAKALEQEYCSREMLEMLVNCVLAKMNFVFCGEPAAGKTECAKFFSQFIPANEKVITIEDNPEWHYRQINPGKDCVELKINPRLDYSKAIKTCLRLNPNWMMLSEVRSREAKALIECWSTGIKGFTTIHTDDVRKIPDRLLNMMENRLDAGRLVNDIYSYVDVGVLLRRKESVRDGKIRRYIDQICFFTRKRGITGLPLLQKGEGCRAHPSPRRCWSGLPGRKSVILFSAVKSGRCLRKEKRNGKTGKGMVCIFAGGICRWNFKLSLPVKAALCFDFRAAFAGALPLWKRGGISVFYSREGLRMPIFIWSRCFIHFGKIIRFYRPSQMWKGFFPGGP